MVALSLCWKCAKIARSRFGIQLYRDVIKFGVPRESKTAANQLRRQLIRITPALMGEQQDNLIIMPGIEA